MDLLLANEPRDDGALYAAALARSSRAIGEVLALRAGGAELTKTSRAELLAKAVAREFVELELTILAYEQKTGEPNRNFVRFRDGAMLSLGRTGKGRPFLRDHRQHDVTSRGGTVLESKTVKVDEGHYRVEQTIQLTDPAAVERALRGLMGSVSIGWAPTGPVECSACGKAVLERGWCWHWPGDQIKLDGGARLVSVEWVYTSAELVETSEVSVPGVPSAGIEGVRAALSAALNGHRGPAPAPQQESNMDKFKGALVAILGLAVTASEDEVVDAVKNKQAKLTALEAQNVELVKVQARHAAEQAVIKEQLATAELEEFVESSIRDRKAIRGSALEASLRNYFTADKEGAKTFLAAMPVVSPVGDERQRDKAAADPKGAGTGAKLEGAAERIKQHSPLASIEGVRKSLLAMGKTLTEANAIIASQLAPKEA